MRKLLILATTVLVSSIHAYEYKKLIDPITDKISAEAEFKSKDDKAFFTYSCFDGKPVIAARFLNNQTTYDTDSQTILRFDKRKPLKVQNSVLASYKPTSEELTLRYGLIQELIKSSLLAIRLNNGATGVFDIQGIDNAFAKVNSEAGCPQVTDYPKLISSRKSAEIAYKKRIEEFHRLAEIERKEKIERQNKLDEEDISKMMSALKQKVKENWVRPQNIPTGLECDVKIYVSDWRSNSQSLTVKIIKSSGNKEFDESIQWAIHNSKPIPQTQSKKLLPKLEIIELTLSPDKD